jgi:hypothetical protein
MGRNDLEFGILEVLPIGDGVGAVVGVLVAVVGVGVLVVVAGRRAAYPVIVEA